MTQNEFAMPILECSLENTLTQVHKDVYTVFVITKNSTWTTAYSCNRYYRSLKMNKL